MTPSTPLTPTSMALAAVITPELHARLDQTSQQRPAHRIQDGWWIRTLHDDNTRTWVHVTIVANGINTETGRSIILLGCVNPDDPGVAVICRAARSELIDSVTAQQAYTLGLPTSNQIPSLPVHLGGAR